MIEDRTTVRLCRILWQKHEQVDNFFESTLFVLRRCSPLSAVSVLLDLQIQVHTGAKSRLFARFRWELIGCADAFCD